MIGTILQKKVYDSNDNLGFFLSHADFIYRCPQQQIQENLMSPF